MSDINTQFATAGRQFADTAAQVNELTLENAEKVFGLHFSAIEQNTAATFAFFGELAKVRDADGLKAVWPRGVQVARENVERSISAGQEVMGRTVKTNEAIAQIAKGSVESATADAQANAEQAVKSATRRAK